jgi:multidrug resistance efflux pump
LREDHEKVEQSLDRLRQIADALDAASPRRASEYIDEADRLVADVILEHERDDESDIYPRISHYLPSGQGLGAMSRAHREIRHQARLLARLAEGPPSHEPDKYLIRDAQRIIEAIETLIRVHIAQEEDVYEQAASEFGGSRSLRETQTRKSEAASAFDRAIGPTARAHRVRRAAVATLAALAILLGGGWLYFRSKRDAPRSGVIATGVIEAARATPISTRLSGTIRAVYCDVGTKVTAGRICAEIDPQPYRAAVEQAKADLALADVRLETARAVLAQMEKRIERQRAEADHAALSKKTLARSDVALSRAREQADWEEASRALRRARLSEAEERLAQTAVAVPVDGTVIAREVKAGLTIEERDAPVRLFLVATDLSVVEIVVALHSSELRQPKIGSQVAFSVASLPGRAFSGMVEQVSRSTPDADHVSTYRVVIEAFNPELLRQPGMAATLMFAGQEIR